MPSKKRSNTHHEVGWLPLEARQAMVKDLLLMKIAENEGRTDEKERIREHISRTLRAHAHCTCTELAPEAGYERLPCGKHDKYGVHSEAVPMTPEERRAMKLRDDLERVRRASGAPRSWKADVVPEAGDD